MARYRVVFYTTGIFHGVYADASNEAIAWLKGIRAIVDNKIAPNKREAWKMKMICLNQTPSKFSYPVNENPNYDPKAVYSC